MRSTFAALALLIGIAATTGCTGYGRHARGTTLGQHSRYLDASTLAERSPCCEDGNCRLCQKDKIRQANYQEELSPRRKVRPAAGRC